MAVRGGSFADDLLFMNRISYLDNIKGLAILLVVFGHYALISRGSVPGNVLMAAVWGAVPCFFMVTGGLMHRAETFSWKKNFRRIARIYLCLAVWKAIYLWWFSVFSAAAFSRSELFRYLFLFGSITNVETGSFWFLEAYLCCLIFFPVSHFLWKRGGEKVMLFLLGLFFTEGFLLPELDYFILLMAERLGCGMINISGIAAVFPLGNYANMLFFFIVGAYAFKYRERAKAKLENHHLEILLPMLFIIAGLAGLLWISYNSTGSLAWQGISVPNGYNRFSTILLAAGIYLLFLDISKDDVSASSACTDSDAARGARTDNATARSDGTEDTCGGRAKADFPGSDDESARARNSNKDDVLCRVLGFVGRYTMGIYYIHALVLALIPYFWRSGFLEYSSVAANLLKTAIVTAICIAVTWIMRKIPLIRILVS